VPVCYAEIDGQALVSILFESIHDRGEKTMVAYTTTGTNELPRAAAFYDALLAEVGAGRAIDMDRLSA